jgi:DNA primase
MTNWIDFKELRQQLNFGGVLRLYGVELKQKGDQHHGFCPLPSHNGKKHSPSFSANLKRGIWQCFGCGGKGNVLDFAVLMEGGNPKNGEDVQRVAVKLRDQFDRGVPESEPAPTASEPQDEDTVINAPLDFELKGLDATHAYLRGRGFNEETIARFGLGFCARGLLKNRIAIPLHDRDGRLVGYAGRVIDDKSIREQNPRYKFPGRRKREGVIHEFRKSLLLYNAHRIEAPVDNLIVVEGFPSVWWLSQVGLNVVGTMGASCSKEQGTTIASLVSEEGRVWVLTDGDAAGERCAQDILFHVADSRFVRWSRLIDFAQPTDLSPEDLRERFPFRSEGPK